MTTDQLFANRYRLERRLGMGGMATVQLAFDTRLERYVAVKLLAEHLAEDANFIARFRREALAAARLVHPNIVQVFDAGQEPGGRQFIVMEFVDGSSCAELLRDRGQLEPAETAEIVAQACRGLDYAHRNGVVHRDVKPGNLLVNRDAVVKLADFGIAKAAEDSDITKVGSVLGTAAYLSPEQARGEAAGPQSDLYALGVVAYQLLAGRLPFEGASLTDLARLQEAGPPLPPDAVAPDVPRALSDAVLLALDPRPETRYADAREMEAAIRDGLRGVPPARDPTAATRALDGDATRVLGGTAATTALPPRRARQPIAEAPPARRVEPERGRGRRRAAAPAASPPSRWSGLRLFVILLSVLALVAAGIGAYGLVEDQTRRTVQLREDVQGNVDRALEELRGLIEDNTR